MESVKRSVIFRKNKNGDIRVLDHKIHENGMEIKIVQYWNNNKHIEQWNRVETPELNPLSMIN